MRREAIRGASLWPLKSSGFALVRAVFLEIGKLPDFRIDFDGAAALIGPPKPCVFLIMSAKLKETPVALAEISNGPSGFESFLERNQKGIVGFAVILAIAAVGVVIYRGIESSREESGGAALSKAQDISGYQTVVNEHANTIAAGSALILLADGQWTEGKKDESVASLQKFVSGYPDHAALPTAKANLGSKLMALGKTGDATKVFESIVSDSKAGFIAPFALISLGDIAKNGGDVSKAEEYYNKAKTDFPESTFAQSATMRLSVLKAKLPTEIDAPPAPPAPPTPDASGMPPGFSIAPQPDAPAATPPQEETPAPEVPVPDGEKPVESPAAPAPNP